MPTIDPAVANYIDATVDAAIAKQSVLTDAKIDAAIERERLIFVDYMKIEREIIRDDIRKIAEMVQDKPSRSEVREMIEENMGNHERRISRLEAKVF